MLRSLSQPERRIVAIGVMTVLVVILVTLGSLNRYWMFRTATQLQHLQDRFDEYRADQESRDRARRQELDDLERTVYAAPGAVAQPVRRASGVEQWMLNSENELRERIKKLEAWRLRAER